MRRETREEARRETHGEANGHARRDARGKACEEEVRVGGEEYEKRERLGFG